jgi:excisionase family DNA binding protein
MSTELLDSSARRRTDRTAHDPISSIAASLPALMSRRQVAATLGLCERTVDRMIARRELATITVAHRVRIPSASVERLLRGDAV